MTRSGWRSPASSRCADRLHDESVHWLKAAGWSADPPPPEREDGPGVRLVARYAAQLTELLEADA